MKHTRPARRGRRPRVDILAATTVLLVVFCVGCPLATPAPSDGGNDTGNDNNSGLDTGSNSSLQNAPTLPLDSNGDLQFTGTIDRADDIDVYEIGTLSPGDEVSVDVKRLNGDLDAVAAIFDSREYLVAFNDDRTPDASNLNPLIDIVIRGESGLYYVAIIAYPGSNTYGQYQATIRVRRDIGEPPPQVQTLYFDWAGGINIDVPNVGTFDLPPFSATDVGFPASLTKLLKQRVQQIVRDRYADYALNVVSSDDTLRPPEPHSTVYFGGADAQAFAISQQIDTFNKDATDSAIIFTNGFVGAFSQTPSLEQMAQAIGNTVAHEVGHLLGLVHTTDCSDLMDTSCTNNRLLAPQEFSTAPIDQSVFPFGMQPETDILSWLIGF